MNYLINEIYDFLASIIEALTEHDSLANTFLSKNIFLDNSLIGLNLTYNDLILYVGTIFFVFFFILILIKLIKALVGLFGIKF